MNLVVNSTGDSPYSVLTEKGSQGIIRASEERKDHVTCFSGEKVHLKCRRIYCNPQQISKAIRPEKLNQKDMKRTLRSNEDIFNFKTHCFYCGQLTKHKGKRKAFDIVNVRTVELKDTILAVCEERMDVWTDAVKKRIMHVHDLHAADAVYHQICSVNFRTKKNIPATFSGDDSCAKKVKLGRPEDKERTDAFLEVAHYLEKMMMSKSQFMTMLIEWTLYWSILNNLHIVTHI